MRKVILVVVLLSLVSCSRLMRVSGVVLDAETKKPVGTCQVKIGKYYAHSDPAGHYSIVANRKVAKQQGMNLECVGYKQRRVEAYRWRTRSLEGLNVEVTPIEAVE